MKKRKNNLWEIRYEQLREYIMSSEEIAELIREYGYINENKLNIEKDESLIKLIRWIHSQRIGVMKKYQNKTISQIEEDEKISAKDKDRMIKLLQIGIKYVSSSLSWEESYKVLLEYINSSEEIEKAFIENGGIKFRQKIEKDGINIGIGKWLQHQKQTLMKKYNGMTIEQIENNKNISNEEKEKLIKLLKIGVTYPKTREEIMLERKEKAEINRKNKELIKQNNSKEIKNKIKKKKEPIKKDDNEKWEKNYKLLIKYINSSEDVKEHFLKTGNINLYAGIEDNEKMVNIGSWLHAQKQNLMKKYQGKTIEDIESNIDISENDKYRMKKLLQLGVSYPMIRETPYNNEWDKNLELLIKYINSSEEAKKYFEETGRVSEKVKVKKGDKSIYIGKWLNAQKKKILEKYKGITIEQIEEDKNIPQLDKYRLKKLLELGINDSSKNEAVLEALKIFKYSSWKEKYDLLSEYINSSDEIKEHFKRKGTIKIKAEINNNGKTCKIGKWLRDQRSIFMKKYSGMTIEQIQNNPEIHEYDKIKIIKLLELGVAYPKITGQQIGKASFDSKVEECDNADKIIENLKERANLKE